METDSRNTKNLSSDEKNASPSRQFFSPEDLLKLAAIKKLTLDEVKARLDSDIEVILGMG